MRKTAWAGRTAGFTSALLAWAVLGACQSGGSGGGGSGTSGKNGFESQSSEPMNSAEGVEYKRALMRCHKNGGSRIVKIEGELRCF